MESSAFLISAADVCWQVDILRRAAILHSEATRLASISSVQDRQRIMRERLVTSLGCRQTHLADSCKRLYFPRHHVTPDFLTGFPLPKR